MIQEAFGEFDVPWRDELVDGWNPVKQGEFVLSDTPGLGVDVNENVLAEHPYIPNSFPSLWDGEWMTRFTQTG
jgi:galactonate dehydratase